MKITSVAFATFCAWAIAAPALSTGASALPLSTGMQHSSIALDPMIGQVQFNGKGGGGFGKGGGGVNRGGGFGGGGRNFGGGGGFNRGGGGINRGGRGFAGGGGRGFNRGGAGLAVGLGVLGLAAAAAAANSGPAYARECWVERRPVSDRWGNYMGTRPTRVCN